jgi:hypothetical protein
MDIEDKITEMLSKIAEKWNIPLDLMEEIYFLYFELLKKILLEGKFYRSKTIGCFYGTIKKGYWNPERTPIASADFRKFYDIKFKASEQWGFRAGSINSDKLYEYCSRFMHTRTTHKRKWFDPSHCAYIDRIDLPVPEKLLKWREEQKKNKPDS